MKKKRRRQFTNKKKRLLIANGFLVLFLFLGIGYSTLSANLNIFGDVTVSKYDNTLYGVLEKEAVSGGLAKEYTGVHQDSMNASLSTKKIYHWYAKNSTIGASIPDKNNVIYRDMCWKLIRTTDTGGVKLLYNGEAVDNKCLDNREDHIGYQSVSLQNLTTSSYYYASVYTYDETNNTFYLSTDGFTGTWSQSTASNYYGKYTCKKTSASDTCQTLYWVGPANGTTDAYVASIASGNSYDNAGDVSFSNDNDYMSNVGYMYNNDNNYSTYYDWKRFTYSDYSEEYLDTAMYVSDTYTGGTSRTDKFLLTSPTTISSFSNYSSLVGKYTLLSTNASDTSTMINYIIGVDEENENLIVMTIGYGHTLTDKTITYTYGDGYIDNGNGTYTIDNSNSFNTISYINNHNNLNNKYVCKTLPGESCAAVYYVIKTSNINMTYLTATDNYKYGKSVTYSNGTYTLTDTINVWDFEDENELAKINTHHYTCLNKTGTCTDVYYAYSYNDYDDSTSLDYFILGNGEKIGDLINRVLNNNQMNKQNSIIKDLTEAWYLQYLSGYDELVEDVIYCNNRTIGSLGALNPDGGSVVEAMKFKTNNLESDLTCPNTFDRFSVSNTAAPLAYPVGLATVPEMDMLGNNISRRGYESFWLMSPGYYNMDIAIGRYINSSGQFATTNVRNTNGLRPMIALTSEAKYLSGDGSKNNPYSVDSPL